MLALLPRLGDGEQDAVGVDVPELVVQGRTGFISSTVDEMVADVERVDTISRAEVRAHVERRFGADRMVEEHLALYEMVARST